MMKIERRNRQTVALPELLAPAGNLEKLKTALYYGADAVYLGGKDLSLRAKAGNFSPDEMAEGIAYAHSLGKKVYVTVNVLAHNSDLENLEGYLLTVAEKGVDGIIVADPGVLSIAKRVIPTVPLHLSTQANVTNYGAARFWAEQGVRRLNLARELSLDEIRTICQKVSVEIEVFVHGAICVSYSGRCMLSSYLTDRDANKGNCSHPCRFSYALVEEKRPGEFYPVEEDGRGTYIFNARDLCLLRYLPHLVASGVDSLKIEGRMKSIFYVGGVVRIYRAALDYLGSLQESVWRDPASIELPENLFGEIEKTGTRGMSENFISARPGAKDMLYQTSRAQQFVEPVAVVRQPISPPLVEIRNRLEPGEKIEYMGRNMEDRRVMVTRMQDRGGSHLTVAHPGNRVSLETEPPLGEVEEHAILPRRVTGCR